jgi:hypothetical protein
VFVVGLLGFSLVIGVKVASEVIETETPDAEESASKALGMRAR